MDLLLVVLQVVGGILRAAHSVYLEVVRSSRPRQRALRVKRGGCQHDKHANDEQSFM